MAVIVGHIIKVKSMSEVKNTEMEVQFRDLSIHDLIGDHYDEAWWWYERYLVIKGS